MNARFSLVQALACAAVLVSMAAFGWPWTPTALAVAIGCLALVIGAVGAPRCPNRPLPTVGAAPQPAGDSQVTAAAAVAAQRRRSPWVELSIRFSIVVMLAVPPLTDAAVPRLINELSAGKSTPTVYAMHVMMAFALGAVYLSSLVDWFYVRPRLSGVCGQLMPCQSSGHEQWRRVTQIWLLHRLAAMLAFVIGLTVVVALAAFQWLEGIDDALATAIAAAATILAGFYLTRAPSTVALALRPAIHVGDTVRVAEPFNYGDASGRYYVVDIALEGVRLLRLDERDNVHQQSAAAGTAAAEHDRLLDLTDASKLVRERGALAPCKPPELCRRVNARCLYKAQGDHHPPSVPA